MVLKRRYLKKTNYRKKLASIKTDKPRFFIKRTLSNFHIQIIEYKPGGDKTITEVTSKGLLKYGWKCNTSNISAAYLTGMLAALAAKKKGIDRAIVDIGMQQSISGSSLYAAAAGAKDAGLKIEISNEVIPSKDRISGKHVALFAKKLRTENSEKYKKQFSNYISQGVDPEKIPEYVEETKKKITEELKNTKEVKNVA